MLGRWKRLTGLIKGRTYVGEDKMGNMYYTEPAILKTHKNGGITRAIDPVDGLHYKTKSLPSEWRSWLSYRRDLPPTEKEIERDLLRRKILKEKVAELEEEDAKLKLQELATSDGEVYDDATSKDIMESSMMYKLDNNQHKQHTIGLESESWSPSDDLDPDIMVEKEKRS